MKEVSLVVVKIVVRMIGILRESWLAGETTHEDFLVVLFGHKVSTSGVKTHGLTFTGCTWQWRISIRLLVEGIAWSSVGLSSG